MRNDLQTGFMADLLTFRQAMVAVSYESEVQKWDFAAIFLPAVAWCLHLGGVIQNKKPPPKRGSSQRFAVKIYWQLAFSGAQFETTPPDLDTRIRYSASVSLRTWKVLLKLAT